MGDQYYERKMATGFIYISVGDRPCCNYSVCNTLLRRRKYGKVDRNDSAIRCVCCFGCDRNHGLSIEPINSNLSSRSFWGCLIQRDFLFFLYNLLETGKNKSSKTERDSNAQSAISEKQRSHDQLCGKNGRNPSFIKKSEG